MSAEVTLTEDEREALDIAVIDDRDRQEGYAVLGPGGTDGQTPTLHEAVERIVAARVEQARAEAAEQERDAAFTSRDNAERENDRLRTERDKLKVRLVGELQAAVEAEGALARVEALLDEWYCAAPEEHTDCKSARLRAALRGDR